MSFSVYDSVLLMTLLAYMARDPDGKLGLVVQGAALAAQLGGAAVRRGRIFGQWSARPILFAEKGGKKCANFGA